MRPQPPPLPRKILRTCKVCKKEYTSHSIYPTRHCREPLRYTQEELRNILVVVKGGKK